MIASSVAICLGISVILLIKRTRRRGRLGVAWIFLALASAVWLYSGRYGDQRAAVMAGALFLSAAIQLLQVAGSELLISRVPRFLIILDLAATAGYASVAVLALLRLGVNITGVFATSALLTAVIGLSLQDLILNFVAGLFVQIEGNLHHGLWIQTDRESGRIMEVRARHTRIETVEGDSIYLPNSLLMKTPVRVVPPGHRQFVSFPLGYEHSPPDVISAVQQALRSAPLADIADEPTSKKSFMRLFPSPRLTIASIFSAKTV